MSLSYIPTVYEQIAIDLLADKELNYADYAAELQQRGWDKEYYDAYVADLQHIKEMMDKPDFNLRAAAAEIRKYHQNDNAKVLSFALTDKEKQTLLEAEDKGRIKAGEVIKYDGYDGEIKGVDYLDMPENIDAFVIFSGHPGTAEPAVKAWLADLRKTGEPKKLIFLGLHDNQGNTNFENTDLKFNVESEAEMYRRYFQAMGVAQEIIDECLITPTDISTEDNIKLLLTARRKYFKADKPANFAMFGYPAYQKRIASEFAFGWQEQAKSKTLAANFYIPDVTPEQSEGHRYFSYDKMSGIMQGIVIGNCLAHPYRVWAGGRFDSKLGEYPAKYKPLLPISLEYSYPNVANELAGTDPKVATMLKIHRALQHEVYGWENPHEVDKTIEHNIMQTKREVVRAGLSSAWLMQHGNKLSKNEYIAKFKSFMRYQKLRSLPNLKNLLNRTRKNLFARNPYNK